MKISSEILLLGNVTDLEKYLSHKNTEQQLYSWNLSDCPDVDDPRSLSAQKEAFAICRIRNVIDQWDQEKKIIDKLIAQLKLLFEEDFLQIRGTISRIEQAVTGNSTEVQVDSAYMTMCRSICDSQSTSTKSTSRLRKSSKVMLGLSAPLWLPLGLVCSVVYVPTMGIKKMLDKRKATQNLKEYSKNRPLHMTNTTEELLFSWMQTGQLKDIVRFKFDKLKDHFSQLIHALSTRLDADRRVIEELKRSGQSNASAASECRNLYMQVKKLKGDFCQLYLTELKQYKYSDKDFSNFDKLGEGAFAVVQKAVWSDAKGDQTAVALKRLKKTLSPRLAAEFVHEAKIYRLV